jgi:hypothetical protein
MLKECQRRASLMPKGLEIHLFNKHLLVKELLRVEE